jgi:hypothetical protein
MTYLRFALILTLILTFSLTGCQTATEDIEDVTTEIPAAPVDEELEEGMDVDVDLEDDTIQVSTEDGQTIEMTSDLNDSLDIPENYPEATFPLYDKEHIVLSMDNADSGFMISGLTEDEMAKVILFYEDLLGNAEKFLTQTSDGMYMQMGAMDRVFDTLTPYYTLQS